MLSTRECHCLICDRPPRRWWRPALLPVDERERRTVRLVREYGWNVTGVLGLTKPDWAYSIGLWHSYGSVEVCLLGVPQQRAMEIVNAVGQRVRDGLVLAPGIELTVEDQRLGLAPVHDSWYDALFGAAIDYYRRPPMPVVQLLWPDRSVHPSLWVPLDEHPPSVWTED